jgi:hypothetical protein
MAIVGADTILTKISSQIDSQFPGFIREEGPQFVAFMKAYFEYMEQAGNPINIVRSLKDNLDIDRTVDSFVEYFRKEFMVNIPKDVLADKRLLAKHIREFYRSRGSQESYRFLFRALFDTELEFYYPGDDILRASDGRWVQETKLRVGKPYSLNPRQFEGSNVRGVTSGATALIQRVTSTVASGLVIYDMVVENVSGLFIDNERVVDDAGNYVTVSAQVGSLIDTQIIDGGAYHNIGDRIEIGGAGSTEPAQGIVTETDNTGGGVQIRITNSGSGYTTRNVRIVASGGSGTGFAAKVASWAREPIATTLSVDIIEPMKNVPIGRGPFFVAGGANTASVRVKLIGTVKLASGSNTIVGQGTSFISQLNVGDIVRVVGSANTLRVHSISTAQTFISAIAATTNITVGAAAYTGLAAANAYSQIGKALAFSASNYYAINAISIINPGYGYTVLPTVTIIDSETSPLNVYDGVSGYLGRNATVSVSNAPGAIKKMRIISPGQNFNRFDNATLLNLSQGNTIVVKSFSSANVSGGSATRYVRRQNTFGGSSLPVPSGIVTFPGRYVDTKGFLSWNNKLQDNYYYQEFSYVLRVSEALDKYRDIVKRVLHPAGTKQFNELTIVSSATASVIVGTTYSNIFDVGHTEYATATDTVVGAKITSATTATESVTATDAMPLAFTTKNVGMEETVSPTDSVVGITTAVGAITESITADDLVVGITTAVANLPEYISATDSVEGIASAVATVTTESITSTDNVTGTYVSVEINSGTQSVTANDSIVGNGITSATTGPESTTASENMGVDFRVGASIIETVTSTDTVVGSIPFAVTVAEQNGEITPYAATQVSTYQSSNISILVNPFLNLDDTVNRS